MRFLTILITALGIGAGFFAPETIAARSADSDQIAIYVGRLLEQAHFTRHRLDDNVSQRLLQMYIETLDYNRMFFTQEDLDNLKQQYGTELDDYLLLGNPKPAYDIYNLYRKRVQERVAFAEAFLKKSPDYTSDRSIEISRQKSPWPKNKEEADKLWNDRLTGELLQVHLSEHNDRSPQAVVAQRYRQLLRSVNEQTDDETLSTFLSSLSQSYDPHSEYMNADQLESFRISMQNSLVGIGAVLVSEDGYAKIRELVTGGPAELSGKIKVNDRIAAVAQGDKDFVDILDMRLDKVVQLIRGKKGTTVRLQILPANASDPSVKNIVDIVRDEVEIKKQQARGEIIDHITPDGKKERLGWITLPSFYSGDSVSTTPTRDITRLVDRMKSEGISGLIIDLRKNGGGSLEEVINLTGLFVGGGPIVQVKDTDGTIKVQRAAKTPLLYDGPMVVLTSRLSASASEIFAAALQDYERAVIVGDHSTFGKGTVQTMLELGRLMSPFGIGNSKSGALKLTIQQFYRVNGGSTQLRGVLSDITLPTITDDPKIGESSLKNPLPYDEIPPADIQTFGNLPIQALKQRSEARVRQSNEFSYVEEDIAKRKERMDENTLSINESIRKKELDQDKQTLEARKAIRASVKHPEDIVYTLTLDNVDSPKLVLEDKNTDKMDEEENEDESLVDNYDAERVEALNILSDLVDLTKIPSATVQNAK